MDDFGIEPFRWLKGSGFTKIDSSFIESSIDFPVFRTLVLRAVRCSKNQALGISVGHRLSLQSHGVLGFALMNCDNLLSAIKLVEQYISIRMPLVKLTVNYQNGLFIALLEENIPLNDLRIIIFDAILVTIKAALDQLMPSLKKDLTLCFPYARHKNVPYGNLSECTLQFNEPAASIQFSQHYLSEPIPFANLAGYLEAEMLCSKELKSLEHETTYKSKIKQKLLENTEFPTQTVMASWFNMTSRTLHRRLIAEGTSYREILEEVKQALAITYLANSKMTIKEIAYFLGYEDDRNFSRAFKRWKGLSPSKYRSLNL
nr:AraC family transcriptional regulator [Alkalimarinus sediminis]